MKVMGILNVTPDSFSDGGKHNALDAALCCAQEMINDGAVVIDVGGESTRPGYTRITDEEEIERVVPVIEAIHKQFDVDISIDTYKAAVAGAALGAGANIVNDIWGLKTLSAEDGSLKPNEDMAKLIADTNAVCVLMHNRDKAQYDDLIPDMISDLRGTLEIADRFGISKDKIILDVGIGFAKSYEDNLCVLKNLSEFKKLGYPLLLGSSRKSVIGNALDLPVGERLEGTIVTSVLATLAGYDYVRVHDVKENIRAIKMTEAIYG